MKKEIKERILGGVLLLISFTLMLLNSEERPLEKFTYSAIAVFGVGLIHISYKKE